MEVSSVQKQAVIDKLPNGETNLPSLTHQWQIKPFGDLFAISGGFAASRDQLSTEGYCYLHYGDIHKSSKTFVDVQREYQDIPKLNVPLNTVSAASMLNDGDVVFVDASEDDDGTSKHVVIINKEKIPFISGLHTIVAKNKTNELDYGYLRYCFQTADIKRQFRFYAVGTKVTGISKTNIARVMLPVPPRREQVAIAIALADADALADSLERLIAKRRLVKQGAMQELLTGKKRLVGFNEPWETKKLGDIGTFSKGAGIRKDEVVDEGIPCIRYGEIYTRHNDYVKAYFSFITKETALQARRIKTGDLLFAGSGETAEDIGKCVAFLGRDEIYAGGDIIVFSPNDQDSKFLGYLMNHSAVVSQKARMGQGDTVVHISATNLASLQLQLPRQAEQVAIVAILADMDEEIVALETKLTKARDLKQGMMQELLTGRTRLV